MEYHYQRQKGVFLTLTYDDACCPVSLRKKDFQDWMKRFRHDVPSVKYFACGEYGEQFGRPHYHVLIFGIDDDHPVFINVRHQCANGRRGYLDSWKFGLVHLGYVSEESCQYVAKYTLKQSKPADSMLLEEKFRDNDSEALIEKPFQLMSRRPALGDGYMREHYERILAGRDPIVRFTVMDETRMPTLPRFVRERCELYERLDSDNGFVVQERQDLRKERRLAYALEKQSKKLHNHVSFEDENWQRMKNLASSINPRGVL